MKLGKKMEAEVLEVYEAYWNGLFNADMETYAATLDKDFKLIGTTEAEIFFKRIEAVRFLEATADQVAGNIELRNRIIKVEPVDTIMLITEQSDTYAKVDGVWTFYGKTRISSLLLKNDKGWKFIQMHISFPDNRTEEGETIALEQIKMETLQLRDAVKRRTIELENKTHDLEIEASLERVRAVALGMKKPTDLPGICEVLFVELTTLEFAEIRNAMINIHDDDKGTFINYDYSDEIGQSINHLRYDIHPVIEKQIRQIRSAGDAFSETHFKGKDLEDWKAFRKNIGEKDDPRIEKTKALYYYFYSIGTGSIGISTFNSISEEKLNVLKRFRNVFDFAYRRYMDVAQAEAQAKEAQIELALERVRARTMAMQKSDELPQAANLLFQQIQSLGMPAWSAGYCIWDDDKNAITAWMSSEGVLQPPFRAPLTEDPSFIHIREAYERGASFHVEEIGGEDLVKHYQYMRTLPVVGDILDSIIEAGHPLPTYQIFHFVYFSKGLLLFITYEPAAAAHDIFKRFGKVFDQTYTRFLDLQQAEAQAREAQIEAALERVRSRSMAMYKSDELADLSLELVKQVQVLGVATWFCAFNIYDESGSGSLEWGSNGEGTFPRYNTPREGLFLRYYEAGKRGETFLINEIGENECAGHYEYLCSLPGVGEQLLKMKALGISFPVSQIDHVAYFKYGYILFITYHPTPESHDIFKRFAKVFEQTYTRFLDLQKAEAQAKEAQIEAALEKVRSRSLAMHKSEELQEVVTTVLERMQDLDIQTDAINLDVFHENKKDAYLWTAVPGHQYSKEIHIPYNEATIFKDIYEGMISGKELHSKVYSRELKDEFLNYVFEHTDFRYMPEERKQMLFATDGSTVSVAYAKNTAIIAQRYRKDAFSDDDNEILKRFARVFEQAYTRFLDLQKAEAQAKEAQIEAALEKVRSRSLAMHNANELGEVVTVIVEKLKDLGVVLDANGVVLCTYFQHSKDVMHWIVSPDFSMAGSYLLPYFDHPIFNLTWQSKENGEEYFSKAFSNAEKNSFFEYAFEHSDYRHFPDEFKQWILQNDQHILSFAWQKNSAILIPSHTGVLPSQEDIAILKRFAKVFEQSYVRFLDLQKAEAQAREAQIEAALERVRSRSMGMQKSEELKEVIKIVYQQLTYLKINLDHAGFVVGYTPGGDWHFWIADEQDIPSKITHPYFESVWANQFNEAKEKGADFFATHLNFEEKNKFYNELLSHVPGLPEASKHFYLSCPGLAASTVLLENVGLYIENFSGTPYTDEENTTLMRFGKVFQQTYTRFLDLQKAEAQAREAQIEAALERVRSRTLAMHKSDELADAAFVLFQQLNQLGIVHERINIGIVNEADKQIDFWVTEQGGKHIHTRFSGSIGEPTTLFKLYAGWKSGQKSMVVDLSGSELKDWLRYLNEEIGIPFDTAFAHERRVQTASFFSKGMLVVTTPEPPGPEAIPILEKFASVFNLTYTRFNDLQIAEAQTHKANIEVALERVRARALAMQQPEELIEVADVMRHEMGLLGVEELETSSIYINKENAGEAECWYSLKSVSGQEKTKVSGHFDLVYKDTWVGRQMFDFYQTNKKEISIVMQGDNRKEWINYCSKHSPVFQGYYGETIPDRTYHLCKFSNGSIGAATPGDISAESWELLQRAASVFSLAYSRFKDLTQARFDLQQLKTEKQRAEEALTELQVTQKQLIQSEKMASLGELTAGIAHEIQNPLNFVNNFSEVSNELIDEMMEEVAKGNFAEVKAIADDVKQNLEKINHHGKRADGIVKGMLQHSRSTSTTMELTDINKLADEYLHLAYHGLRAKDKLFNAALKTDYDTTLEKINVIPQDIGRVILNLINNAFYAVSQRQKVEGKEYEATVSVSTKKTNDHIEISVKDNGKGISQKIIDKIFQPFFTTKPTGQGTGLGLSLAYDIVKAHGGELKVETAEGEGSEFIIQLPII